jgi:acetyltransferase-like isoleucine patch superfamily enzyme
MRILGMPNYLSSKVYFDGTDYSLIELNEGCTISSNVRILTHDWSLYTAGRGLGMKFGAPVGILRPVRIGRFVFVGMGSILLPGADIGDGTIIGAGSIVRGKIEGFSVASGNPAVVVGTTREFMERKLAKMGDDGKICGRQEDLSAD